MSEGKLTSVQASSNEVMIYWLTTLQVRLCRVGMGGGEGVDGEEGIWGRGW